MFYFKTFNIITILKSYNYKLYLNVFNKTLNKNNIHIILCLYLDHENKYYESAYRTEAHVQIYSCDSDRCVVTNKICADRSSYKSDVS